MPARACCIAVLLLGAAAATAAGLPAGAAAALQRARVPAEALSVVVREVGSGGRTLLLAEADRPVNPASLTKLLTTYAALDRLGPAYVWTTPVWVQGSIRDGVLDGSVAIRGSGDPRFGIERLWLLLRRLRELGVREIRGDIVLDNSAFAVEPGSAADFDGDATRPYNIRAEALLLNHKAVRVAFVPDAGAGVARVLVEPARPGAPATLPLRSGTCGAWLTTVAPQWGGDGRLSFGGGFPAACGEREWWVADPQPATYNARLIAALWAEGGGVLKGSVRDGAAPQQLAPTFELKSPPLAEVVRDVNKYSNNLMAQQIFYTLDPARPATAAGAREALRGWLAEKLGALPAAATVIDNGSGLSRETRISAATLARLLALAWDGPLMPELVASLPISGVDGTLRRQSSAGAGRAHLKTGSLRDVAAVAGYVLGDSGRRYVLVAIVQHPDAAAARPALDALLQWTLRDGRSVD